MSSRYRTTRLSTGSVVKRSYVDASSDEDEGGGGGRQRRAVKARRAASASSDNDDDGSDTFQPKKRSNGKRRTSGGRTKRRNDSESRSGSQFEEGEDDDDDDDEAPTEEGSDSEEEGYRKIIERGKKADKVRSAPRSNAKADLESEVTQIVRAPSKPTPANQVSPHTLDFMRDMQDPRKNDRDWFAVHKNVFDYAHANWLDFTGTCLDALIDQVDDTIAWMPAKQLVERIYRDVRFSNDKTPYKRHLSWCMSRGGRKGNYAKFYCALSANGRTALHVGLYEASKEDLQAMRDNIVNKTVEGRRLRALVTEPSFVEQFGTPPKSSHVKVKKGATTRTRTSLWGGEDELKKCPKGYDSDHPDIDWLRLKTFAVSHHFTDKQVVAPDFIDRIVEVARAAQPLVEVINTILHGAVPAGPVDW